MLIPISDTQDFLNVTLYWIKVRMVRRQVMKAHN